MKITLVVVGKLKEKFWIEACEEYLKRLQPYARVKVIEVPDIDPTKAGGIQQAREKEGSSIIKALSDSSRVILLAIEGKQRSSVEFSRRLESWGIEGQSDVSFVIGGSDGVSSEVMKRADETLSFGKITLPHNLARVVLLEQIYRAFKISRNEPYHK